MLSVLLLLLGLGTSASVSNLQCQEEEKDGYVWYSKSVGESVVHNCSGVGYYRRICLFKKTTNGPVAYWSRIINMCKCKGDSTWKETPTGQYAYIVCPGAYDGYIGRYCTESGEWGETKDMCYLPDSKKEEEFEVEL